MGRDLVDLHNHILHGVDDGAADLEESLALAREFVSEGVTRIAATPHFNPENQPARRGAAAPVVVERVAELKTALVAAHLQLTVVPGNELYLTPQAPELLQSGTVSTLGGGTTVLVELSLSLREAPPYLDTVIDDLHRAGYSVVLAHPERYPLVQRDITALDSLVEHGVLLQLTAPALLGEYGATIRHTAERLLLRGAYRLASSDRHHPGPKRSLAQLHEKISEATDTQTADALLCDNPAAVLDGTPVPEAELRPEQQSSIFGRVLGRHGH